MSQVFVETVSFEEAVASAPVVVHARIGAAEPEIRRSREPITRPGGGEEAYNFEGAVWRFEIIEVLKWNHFEPPAGKLDVIASHLEEDYANEKEFHASGAMVSPIRLQHEGGLASGPGRLPAGEAILLLALPVSHEDEGASAFRRTFAGAFPLALAPGLIDPARGPEVRRLIEEAGPNQPPPPQPPRP